MEKFTKEELKDFIIGLSVVAFCLFCCLLFKINRNVWHGTDDTDYTLYATFNKTDGLVVGDKVRLSGVDIGRVVDSVLDNNYRAVLSLKINSRDFYKAKDLIDAYKPQGFVGIYDWQ